MTDVAFFGGSFNPPHTGHFAVISFLATLAFFDEVWIVPSFTHPFSKPLADYDLRLEMCSLAFTPISSKIKIMTVERDCGANPSYSLPVIRYAKTQYPYAKFWLVLGSDCQRDLPQWHRYQQLKNEVNFFFLPRPGHQDSPFPAVSSSQVRERLLCQLPCENLLKAQVFDFIREHHLYGS